jgi:hypothetical protein
MDKEQRTLHTDDMTTCPICGSSACYHTQGGDDFESYMCFTCGYSTSSHLKTGSPLVKQTRDSSAELIKDLEIEKDGFHWFPTVMNIEGKGIVFPDGTNKEEWKWASMLSVPVKEEEKTKYPIPGKKGEFYSHRLDNTTMVHYDKLEFMDALEKIGMFEK